MIDFISALEADLPSYLRDLESLVNIDCGTYTKTGVDAVGRIMRERFQEFGAEVQVFAQEQYGDCVYGRWRGQGTARIVMIGHMDTVYSEGTVSQFAFRKLAGRLLGPGVNDMKSGLLAGLYAAHAIARAGFDQFAEIGLFCNTEEEVGSPISKPLYSQFAKGANAALILEAARESGAIVSARKGVGHYEITVHGKAAHAGVEPERGANAILALARYTEQLQALNDFRPGLTLNVGVVRGGSRSNVVADHAQAQIDVRVMRMADAIELEQAMREILVREVVSGTKAELIGEINFPPMERTAAISHLVDLAKNAAREIGFELQDVATGGGSDGNNTAALGTPTLDGLGPVGGKGHNAAEEWMDPKSIVPRTAMLAKLMVAIAENK